MGKRFLRSAIRKLRWGFYLSYEDEARKGQLADKQGRRNAPSGSVLREYLFLFGRGRFRESTLNCLSQAIAALSRRVATPMAEDVSIGGDD